MIGVRTLVFLCLFPASPPLLFDDFLPADFMSASYSSSEVSPSMAVPAAPLSLLVDCRLTGVARHCGPGRLDEEDDAVEGAGEGAAAAVGGGGLSSRGLRGRSIMPPMSESEDLSNFI